MSKLYVLPNGDAVDPNRVSSVTLGQTEGYVPAVYIKTAEGITIKVAEGDYAAMKKERERLTTEINNERT